MVSPGPPIVTSLRAVLEVVACPSPLAPEFVTALIEIAVGKNPWRGTFFGIDDAARNSARCQPRRCVISGRLIVEGGAGEGASESNSSSLVSGLTQPDIHQR